MFDIDFILLIVLASVGVLLGYLSLVCIGKLQHRILMIEDALKPADVDSFEVVENE